MSFKYLKKIGLNKQSKKNKLILFGRNFKLLKSKFVVNFITTLIKNISTTISITPLIIMDYVIDMTKEFRVAFTSIFGISILRCEQLKKLFGFTINKCWKLKHLDKRSIFEAGNYFNSTTVVGFNLSKLIASEKEKFLETRCFKRNRYLLGLPANGQRTHTNAMTARRFRLKI